MSYRVQVELPPGKGSAGCRGCGEVFTCVSAFDHHQKLRPEEDGGGVICMDPEERGLHLWERPAKDGGEPWLVWGWPPQESGTAWYDEKSPGEGAVPGGQDD